MEKTCLECSINYISYRTTNKFCSCSCKAKHFSRISMPHEKNGDNFSCEICGTIFYRNLSSQRPKMFCSNKCKNIFLRGMSKIYGFKKFENTKNKRKYKEVRVDGKKIGEHRHIMQEFLGRKLESWEHVHHINNDPLDNRIENLVVLNHSSHSRLTCLENNNFKIK